MLTEIMGATGPTFAFANIVDTPSGPTLGAGTPLGPMLTEKMGTTGLTVAFANVVVTAPSPTLPTLVLGA